MPTLSNSVLGLFAVGHVDTTGVGAPTFSKQRGFASVVSGGVGVYTLTMSQELNLNESFVAATVQDQGGGGSRGNITVGQPGALNTLVVRTFLGGIPADQHFWIGIWDLGNN